MIDAAASRIVATIPVGRRPWGVVLSPDGRRLYTANGLFDDVSVVDTAAGRVVGTIGAGAGPCGIALRP